MLMNIYNCDPDKNINCPKESCYVHGGPCSQTTNKEYEMENEIRYYLKQMLACMEEEEGYDSFKPTYLITAVKLPTGAIELAVNN